MLTIFSHNIALKRILLGKKSEYLKMCPAAMRIIAMKRRCLIGDDNETVIEKLPIIIWIIFPKKKRNGAIFSTTSEATATLAWAIRR